MKLKHARQINEKTYFFAGTITIVVLLFVKDAQIMYLVKGKSGARIKNIAAAVEQDLRSFYLNDVHIRLVIVAKKSNIDMQKKKSKRVDKGVLIPARNHD